MLRMYFFDKRIVAGLLVVATQFWRWRVLLFSFNRHPLDCPVVQLKLTSTLQVCSHRILRLRPSDQWWTLITMWAPPKKGKAPVKFFFANRLIGNSAESYDDTLIEEFQTCTCRLRSSKKRPKTLRWLAVYTITTMTTSACSITCLSFNQQHHSDHEHA